MGMHGAMQDQAISVDLTTNCMSVGGAEIRLKRQEAELAFALVKRMPGGASKDDLISALWGVTECREPVIAIRTVINGLRRKTEAHGVKIETVYAIGYRMLPAKDQAVQHAA